MESCFPRLGPAGLCDIALRAELKRQTEKANRVVVQFESPLERLSDCRTVPYLRFFLVRNATYLESPKVGARKPVDE